MSSVVDAKKWSHGGAEAVRSTPWNIDRTGPGPFRYHGKRWTFTDVIVSDTRQTPCSVLPRHPPSADDEHFTTVFFIADGLFSITEAPELKTFGTGAAGWVPGWSRVACETHVPTRFIAVALHERVLQKRRVTLPAPMGRVESRDPLLAPTLAFLHTFTTDPDLANRCAEHPTGDLIADMVTALLPRTAPHDHPEPDLHKTALILIKQLHTDAEFDPRTLAERMHISLRQLQRVFADNNETVHAALTRERLATAVTALHSPTARSSVTESAERAGMTVKEFRHAAMTSYGLTPRQLRTTSTTALPQLETSRAVSE